MRITDQDAAASRLLGRGQDARAYLAFRKTEQLCVAFLKRYRKGEYAVDVEAIRRFAEEELDRLGASGEVQRKLREAAFEKVPELLEPVPPSRVAAGPVSDLLDLRVFRPAGEGPTSPTGSQVASVLRTMGNSPPARVSGELHVPGRLGLRPHTPVVVGTASVEWPQWRKLPACVSGEAPPLPGKQDACPTSEAAAALEVLSVSSPTTVSDDLRGQDYLALYPWVHPATVGDPRQGSRPTDGKPIQRMDRKDLLSSIRCIGLPSVGSSLRYPGPASAFDDLTALAGPPASGDLRVPGLLATQPLPATGDGASSPGASRLASALGAMNASSTAPVSSDLGVPDLLVLRSFPDVAVRTASLRGPQIASAIEGLDASAAVPALQDLRVSGFLGTRPFVPVTLGSVSPAASRVASALKDVRASSPTPVSDDLHVPDWLTLRPLSDVPLRTASRAGPQIAVALEGLDALAGPPAVRDLDVPGLLATRSFSAVGEGAAPPAASRVASALGTLSESSPTPVSDNLRVPGLLVLRRLPSVLVSTVGEGWLPWRTLPACESGDARQLLGKQDACPTSRAVGALRALSAPTVVSADLPVPEIVALSVFPPVAAGAGSRGGPQITNALKSLEASPAAPASRDLAAADLLETQLFPPVGERAVPPAALRVTSALTAVRALSPTPVSTDLSTADLLDVHPLPRVAARAASPSGPQVTNTLEGLEASAAVPASRDFDVPGLLGTRPFPPTGEHTAAPAVSRVASALSAMSASPPTPMSHDLRVPELLDLRALPTAVVSTVSGGWLPWRTLPACVSGDARRFHGKQDARPTSQLEPLGERALGGAPELLSVEKGAGGRAPVDGPALVFEMAVSRRLAGAYYGLGEFFDDVDDVETGALMYREAVALGPHGARHFRLACRALARAYRRARDRPGLDWLASTLEAWPDAEPWAQELAARIRPRGP